MIIFFTSAKGGVGSSTLSALLAKERSSAGRVVLVDAARDPSLDLYTSSEHLVQEPYSGSLSGSAIPLDEAQRLCLVRLEPDKLSQVSLEEELSSGLFSDFIFDLGQPDETALGFLQQMGPEGEVLVVLTQDNEVLRAADRLLGSLRNLGIDARFIVNKMEERDAQELADLDEIFSLLEEDYLGFVRYDHSLRYEMNRGKLEEVASGIRVNVAALNDKLNGEKQGSDQMSQPAAAVPEQTEERPDGVLSKIRKFFRNFGKGN